VAALPKRLGWIASSRRDMRSMPPAVKRVFGLALFAVQCGETPPIAKPLKGFGGAGVLELVEDHRGGVFQKKSKHGRQTPQEDVALIKRRLRQAEEIDAAR
jgi:phage-related protein